MDVISIKDFINIKTDSKDKNSKTSEGDGFNQMLAALFANIQNQNNLNNPEMTTEKHPKDTGLEEVNSNNIKKLMNTINSLNLNGTLHNKVNGSNEEDLNILIEQLTKNTGNNTVDVKSNDIMNLIKNVQLPTASSKEKLETPNITKLAENIPQSQESEGTLNNYLATNHETKVNQGTPNKSFETITIADLTTGKDMNNLTDNSNANNKERNLEKNINPGLKFDNNENKLNVKLSETKDNMQPLKSSNEKVLNIPESKENKTEKTILDNKVNSNEKLMVDSTNINEVKQDTALGSHIEIPKLKAESKNIEAKEIVNVTRPKDIIDIAVTKFKALKLPEITELKVKLRPEELGNITVKVVFEKGQINGNITADSKDVVNMIQNQMDNLKEELRNNNVNLNNLSVNINSGDSFNDRRGSGQFSEEQKKQNRSFNDFFIEDLEDNEKETGFNIIA